MRKVNINGNRLALLRQSRGWSQDEFARRFAEFAPKYDKDGNLKPPMKTMTISNWETGRKMPPSETLLQLATFYGVSFDYICGRTNSEEIQNATGEDLYTANQRIKTEDLYKYDGKPVYIQFNSSKYKDQWGIVNYANGYIVCDIGKVKIDNKLVIFVSEALNNLTIHNNGTRYLLGMRDLLTKEYVYIEPIDYDERVAHIIRGWYKHSENKEYLINKKNGYILPYEALGETYNAYDNM